MQTKHVRYISTTNIESFLNAFILRDPLHIYLFISSLLLFPLPSPFRIKSPAGVLKAGSLLSVTSHVEPTIENWRSLHSSEILDFLGISEHSLFFKKRMLLYFEVNNEMTWKVIDWYPNFHGNRLDAYTIFWKTEKKMMYNNWPYQNIWKLKIKTSGSTNW